MQRIFVVLSGVILGVALGVFCLTGCDASDTDPPQVEIRLEPCNDYCSELFDDSVKGVVKVVATATDNVGVDHVIFLLNNHQIWQEMRPQTDEDGKVRSDEFVYFWDTKLLDDSVAYSLSAAAFDEAGNADTSQSLTCLVRIPNVPPNPVWDTSRSPFDGEMVVDSAGAIWLEWIGSDPDTLPLQILTYNVYFGHSRNSLERVADSIAHRGEGINDTSRTRWNTINMGYTLPPPGHRGSDGHFYWMIESIDPYGQKALSDTFEFYRPQNRNPFGSSTDDTLRIISYPDDGKAVLAWHGTSRRQLDPEADTVKFRLYFGEASSRTDWEHVSLIGTDIELTRYEVDVEPEKTYYWRPVAEDMWGAVMDSLIIDSSKDPPETTVIALWRLVVED